MVPLCSDHPGVALTSAQTKQMREFLFPFLCKRQRLGKGSKTNNGRGFKPSSMAPHTAGNSAAVHGAAVLRPPRRCPHLRPDVNTTADDRPSPVLPTPVHRPI
ncbi:hypothetical protein U1Q18_031466 [Sarracenia purpurea var. burkii]